MAGTGLTSVMCEGLLNAQGQQYWNTLASQDQAADLDFVSGILDNLDRDFSIDNKRVYATGISNGGGMANLLATEMTGTIAAIATVAGAYFNHDSYSPSLSVPVMAFHGTEDRVVPYTGSRFSAGGLPDIRDWIDFWVTNNGCSSDATLILDLAGVSGERWGNCNSPVELYTHDKGHSWPGSSMDPEITTDAIDASQLMVDFFLSHSRS